MGQLLGHHPWEFKAARADSIPMRGGIHACGQGRGVVSGLPWPSAVPMDHGNSKVVRPGRADAGIACVRSLFMGLSTGHQSWDLVTLAGNRARLLRARPGDGVTATSRDDPRRRQVTICGSLERSPFMGRSSQLGMGDRKQCQCSLIGHPRTNRCFPGSLMLGSPFMGCT